MKKRMLCWLLALALMVPVLGFHAAADMGPKPSTHITVHPGAGERVVLTLLAEAENDGPHWPVKAGEDPANWQAKNDIEREAWYAFRDHTDPDGFHFWGEVFDGVVNWNYYPPERFKIAVYYPDYDVMLVSEEVYERYAFASSYRLNLPALGEQPRSGTLDMILREETDLWEETAGFLFRVALTVAIELALAGLAGLRSGKGQKLILRTNLVTQVILNALLWIWYFFDGPMSAMGRLLLAELVVLLTEGAVYLRALSGEHGRLRVALYTMAANLASAALGLLLL